MSAKEASRAPKRQKTAIACEECRSRKVRCDGGRPQCSSCRRRNNPNNACSYPSDIPKPVGDRDIIRFLYERVQILESRLGDEDDYAPQESGDGANATKNRPLHHTAARDETKNSDDRPDPQENNRQTAVDRNENNRTELTDANVSQLPVATSRYQMVSDTQLHISKDQITSEAYEVESDQQRTIDAMGIASSVPEATTSWSPQFYGNPSTASFFTQIQDTLCGQCDRPGNMAANTVLDRQPLGLISTLEDYHLPPRKLADRLLDLYYTRVHCLYPYMHWPSVVQAYNRLWISEKDVQHNNAIPGIGIGASDCSPAVFCCALNVIFALGGQFTDETPQERKLMVETFFARAKRLMQLEFLDHGDIGLVQALLITAQYLQSTNLPSRCWNVAGIAYRMAQGLGLHLEDNQKRSLIQREIRRRTWHGCVCLDLVLSMTLGRPSLSSHESTVPLPSSMDDEELTHTYRDPGTSVKASSRTAFFVQTIALYQILGQILHNVYKPWDQDVRPYDNNHQAGHIARIGVIIELHEALRRFEENLPVPLRKGEHVAGTHQSNIAIRQRNVLQTRYLHLRILLHRPLLVYLCQRSYSPPQTQSTNTAANNPASAEHLFLTFSYACSIGCAEAALDLISLLDATSQTPDTGAWWYNAYYICHATMILALAELCPSVQEAVGNERCESSRQQCRTILSRMAAQSSESHRYLKLFESMCRMVQLNIQGPKISGPNAADAGDLVLDDSGRHAWGNPGAIFAGSSVPFFHVDHTNLDMASGPDITDFAPDLALHGSWSLTDANLPGIDFGDLSMHM